MRRADAATAPATPQAEGAGDTVVTSKALRAFLSYLGSRPAPVLLDLGPFVGSNVTFFGDRLNCKVLIEDLFVDLERHVLEGRVDKFPSFLSTRFSLDAGSVDGVLLWDLYDYLDRPAAQVLAATIVRLLRPDGALLGFFGNAKQAGNGCTKFIVMDDSRVRQRSHAFAAARRGALQNRDIIKMFDGMRVADSFLLKSGRREMLFRKGGVGRPII